MLIFVYRSSFVELNYSKICQNPKIVRSLLFFFLSFVTVFFFFFIIFLIFIVVDIKFRLFLIQFKRNFVNTLLSMPKNTLKCSFMRKCFRLQSIKPNPFFLLFFRSFPLIRLASDSLYFIFGSPFYFLGKMKTNQFRKF